jgi:hypothetical protein
MGWLRKVRKVHKTSITTIVLTEGIISLQPTSAQPPETPFEVTPISRIDTTETADNLPGPGRGLDKVYQALGRKLERGMGIAAEKAGFGPEGTERKIKRAAEFIEFPVDVRVKRAGQKRIGATASKRLVKLRLAVAEKAAMRGCDDLTKYSRCAGCL